MICKMNHRVARFVALLGLSLTAASRPALAQQPASDNWFYDSGDEPASDNGAGDAPPLGPRSTDPGRAPVEPPAPRNGSGAPSDPGPAAPAQDADVPETDPSAITEFRPTLDPYGNWLDDPKYGTVWVPNRDVVGGDFAPYVSAGHWALTEDSDWIWQSDYPFGGVVFHYGRWVWVPGTGWGWVAGRRYANAWVDWRVSSDGYGYIGWAPMPPAWGWRGGFAVSLGWYPPAAYVFCPTRYAFSYGMHSYIVRDRYVIHDVAANTRHYADGRVQHVAASPRVLPANSLAPRGPSLQSARIPAAATPVSRVPVRSANAFERSAPRVGVADNYARGTFPAGTRATAPASYRQVPSERAVLDPNPSRAVAPRSAFPSRPAYSAPVTTYRSAPSTRYSAPSTRYSVPSTRYSVPSTRYSAPSTRYSAPATRYSAPATRYSVPSTRYSSPSQYSAPAMRSAPSFQSAPSHYSAPAMRSAPSFQSAPSRSFHSPSRR